MEHLEISTRSRCEMVDITAELRALVRRKAADGRWQSGALALFCPHTTCGLTVNEGADPDVRRDMLTFFNGLVPRLGDYHHAEGNSDAHLKTTLIGPSLMLVVEDGDVRLGTWQGIYLFEGDGPRTRSIWLQFMAA